MPRITVEEFKTGLRMIPGVVVLTLRSRVQVQDKMYKRDKETGEENPFYDRVTKIVTANGTIGADYENAVNRARDLAGIATDFVAGPRPWGEYVNSSFIYHSGKDRWYIRFIERSRKERWYLDGKVVDKRMFSQWLKPEKDEAVKYRNFAVDNFLFIRWRGQTYRLAQEVRV